MRLRPSSRVGRGAALLSGVSAVRGPSGCLRVVQCELGQGSLDTFLRRGGGVAVDSLVFVSWFAVQAITDESRLVCPPLARARLSSGRWTGQAGL